MFERYSCRLLSLCAGVLGILMPLCVSAETIDIINDLPPDLPRIKHIRQVTHGPKHHFFGYYGICPWDATGRYLVCLESDFGDRLVQPDDKARICLIDLHTGKLEHVAKTSAWNFQQGAMVHWLGTNPEREIIFNDRIDGKLAAVVLDVHAGTRRVLDQPVAAVANDGKTAASISYARLRTTRPGYGYAGAKDPFAEDPHPKQDGLYHVDLHSGKSKLIVSLDAAFGKQPVPPGSEKNLLWFNHVLFSRDDKRIFFMARIHDKDNRRQTAAFTVNADGSDLRCVLPYSWGASHYDWLDGTRLMVTTRYQGHTPWLHTLFTDGKDDYRPLGADLLTKDGHGHFAWDRQWMVTDGYPDKDRKRALYLMNMKTETVRLVARFYEPPKYKGPWRCDLHPRWSRDNRKICIDSTQDGTRQVYIVELGMPADR